MRNGFWRCCITLAYFLLLANGMQAARAQEFLDPEVAFQAKARMITADKLEVTLTAAKGYYLYRERFQFEAIGAQLGEIQIPKGKVKYDATFEKEVEIYYDRLVVLIPVKAKNDFTIKLGLQGCADLGLCYPPMEIQIPIKLNGVSGNTTSPEPPTNNHIQNKISSGNVDDMSHIAQVLQGGRLLLIVPLFFFLGLGLSFTPCVLPMLPILSFIIVGEGQNLARRRSFALSLSYVLGMALVYTALGVAAGLLGEGLSATLQHPWVLSGFAILMVALSLAMFGVYQLQMPVAIQTKLTRWSEAKRNGKLLGVFLMGAVSALIVGPCVAAPLAGALVYISQSRDVIIGASALFAMALGMGVPLLLIGLSAGSLLPRAGAWMQAIKQFFGVLMLALALWMVSPILPAKIQMAAWMILFVSYSGYLIFFSHGKHYSKLLGIVFFLLGGMQSIGLMTGGKDPLSPLAHLGQHQEPISFQRIKTTTELDRILANNQSKIVMLDFYADWCVSCIEMEKLTFVDPKIKAKLDNMLLLQIDVTANNIDDKTMLKRFGLFGPPGIIFFDNQGKEMQGKRVIGYQNAERFLSSLEQLNSR